jgi:hypothetical protein
VNISQLKLRSEKFDDDDDVYDDNDDDDDDDDDNNNNNNKFMDRNVCQSGLKGRSVQTC